MTARISTSVQITFDKGRTWQPVPIIEGSFQMSITGPVRRKAGKRRKRAQQVRRSLR